MPHSIDPRGRHRQFLQKLLFVVLVFVFVGLCVYTIVDILPQSLTSGQFWNAIIVVSAVALAALWGASMYVARIVRTRRWLSRTPRSYQISSADVPMRVWQRICAIRKECDEIFDAQLSNQEVVHPGLQNPLAKSEHYIESRYSTVLESLPELFEAAVLDVEFALAKLPGQHLSEYIETVAQDGLIGERGISAATVFIDLYERARFSGKQLYEEELLKIISALCDVTGDLYDRVTGEFAQSGQLTTDLSRTESRNSLASSVQWLNRPLGQSNRPHYAQSARNSIITSASVIHTPARPAWTRQDASSLI